MNLKNHPKLDALCMEYLSGLMSPRVRARFTQALHRDPDLLRYLHSMEQTVTPSYGNIDPEQPSPRVWARINHSLGLESRAQSTKPGLFAQLVQWFVQMPRWVPALYLSTFLMIVGTGLFLYGPGHLGTEPALVFAQVDAGRLSLKVQGHDHAMQFSSVLVAQASGNQVLELWLIPHGQTTPVAVGVLKQGSSIAVQADSLMPALIEGATLAVSVEPAGGSPSSGPTGPVTILQKA